MREDTHHATGTVTGQDHAVRKTAVDSWANADIPVHEQVQGHREVLTTDFGLKKEENRDEVAGLDSNKDSTHNTTMA